MSVKTETSHKFPVWIIIVAALLAAGFAGFMLANKGIGLPSLPSSEKTSSGGFPVYPKNDFPGIYKVKGSIINPEAMKGIITITHQVNAQPVSSVIKILADIKVKNVSGGTLEKFQLKVNFRNGAGKLIFPEITAPTYWASNLKSGEEVNCFPAYFLAEERKINSYEISLVGLPSPKIKIAEPTKNPVKSSSAFTYPANPKTPEETVLAILGRMNDGRWEEAGELISSETSADYDWKDNYQGRLKNHGKIVKVEVEPLSNIGGDDKAKINVKVYFNDGDIRTSTWELNKKDGVWKY